MKVRLHSIPIRFKKRTSHVHWSFLLIPGWMVVINLFSAAGFREWIWGMLLLFAYLLSLLVHEGAHILAGKAFGFRERDFYLLPSGSVGGGIDSIFNFRIKTVILLAGPLTNLAIAFLLKFYIQPYSAYWNEPANIGVVDSGNFLFQLHLINLSLGIINLIPVLPTDAGRILRGILDMRVGVHRSKVMMAVFSKWAAITGLIIGIYFLNLLLILFAIYVLLTLKAEDHLPAQNFQSRFTNSADQIDFFLNSSHFS